MSVSKYEVILSFDARQDIYTTVIYLEQDKPKLTAENWKKRIIEALESLSQMPHRCPGVFEEEDIGGEIRSLLCHPHKIMFEISEKDKRVVVLRIYHERREPLTLENLGL
jgi:plasmid stabilization system protein ParE